MGKERGLSAKGSTGQQKHAVNYADKDLRALFRAKLPFGKQHGR